MSKTIFIRKTDEELNRWSNTQLLFEYLSAAPAGNYKITIEKSDKRTNPMNNYFHGVLVPEFKQALIGVGYDEIKTDDQAKEIIKRMFLTDRVTNSETGEVLEYTKNTRDLTKEEMSNLFDEVIKFAAEKMDGYQIPYPNEQLNMYE